MSLHRVSTSGTPSERPKNRILAALPPADYQRLRAQLVSVVVQPREVLHRTGDPLTTVYFPNGGVYSITTALADGSMVEAATIGDEGMVGIEAVLAAAATGTGDAMLQVPSGAETDAWTLSVTALREELAQGSALQDLLGRYAQTVFGQAMQSLACNTLHNVQERCCRWLLMTHDRIHSDEFLLSHEFLATMLGTRRQSVTVVAGALQTAGFIRYKHGRMTVLDRDGLEAGACECYAAVRTQIDQLFS
jgi:CRP-like cAMP-binding protein